MKNRNLYSKEKEFNKLSKYLDLITKIITVGTIVISFCVIVWNFGVYIWNRQWFQYWNIDMVFYSNMGLVNTLIYYFAIFCILILFTLYISEQKKQRIFQMGLFIFTNLLFGIDNMELSITYIFSYFVVPCVIFQILLRFKFFVKLRSFIKQFSLLTMFIRISTVFIVGIFVSILIISQLNVRFTKRYKIITNLDEKYVILYSATNYYIVSDYIINEDTLVVKNSRLKKIDTNNIEYNNKTFEQVCREMDEQCYN